MKNGIGAPRPRWSAPPVLLLRIAAVAMAVWPWVASTAPVEGSAEAYARAERLLPHRSRALYFNAEVSPGWIADGERFWYRNRTRAGAEFVVVDAARNSRRLAFDRGKLADALNRAFEAGNPAAPSDGRQPTYDARDLPVDQIVAADRRDALVAEVGPFRCAVDSYRCDAPPPPASTEVVSPDGSHAAFVREHDLYVRTIATGQTRRLTHDGAVDWEYGRAATPTSGAVTARLTGHVAAADVLWSPDSVTLLTYRIDERRVRTLHLVQAPPLTTAAFPQSGDPAPRIHRYHYPLPGDPVVPSATLHLFDAMSGQRTDVALPAIVTYSSPIAGGRAWWTADSRRIFAIDETRAAKVLTLREIDRATGAARVVIEETGQTYVEATPLPYGARPNVRTLRNGAEAIWYSERDGWGHLYRYDTATGRLLNRVTTGSWIVLDIAHVDEPGGWIYVIGSGREPEQDPYDRHLYRVRLDGSELQRLTPEPADHQIVPSPAGRFFVDTIATVASPPKTVLRAADGTVIRELERADVSELLAEGMIWPERFHVPGRDGTTEVYGVLFRPSHFNPTRRYPLLDYIYQGPQRTQSPRSLLESRFWDAQSIAELGFLVVTIEGAGTPFRSKTFHDVAYRNLGDAGLEDHVAAIRALAARVPAIDLDRVGVFGHSAGGYAAARAMLRFPRFFKVGVASAGNHDARSDKAPWVEKYMGPLGPHYAAQANAALAPRLEGKLLLVHGEMDDNVHPTSTLQFAAALIAAGKPFDLLLLPNRDHVNVIDPTRTPAVVSPVDMYFIRRRWDYFVRHLLGVEPPGADGAPVTVGSGDAPPAGPSTPAQSSSRIR